MESVVLIKSVKKYKKYNLSIDMENILLTGYKSESIIDKKFNTHYLVKQTCELGKSIYEIIKEAEEKYSIYNVDMTIKIDNPKDKKTINKKIKDYINEFKSIIGKNHSHYLSMFEFYKEAFNLLKKYKKISPNELIYIPIQIKSDIDKATMDYYESFGEKSKSLEDINRAYNTILSKILDIVDECNCRSLISKMQYIPFTIKYLFDRILINGNGTDNKEAVKISEAIINWCKEFGMPFWTERKKIAEYTENMIIMEGHLTTPQWKENAPESNSYSLREYANNTISVNGLITISIVMYLLYSLWEEYTTLKNISDSKQKDLEFLKSTMGTWARDIIDLIEQADKYNNYIMNNFNSIGSLKLEINEKKIPYTKNYNTVFRNVTEYESIAIAAWSTFYHDYLGNLQINSPIPYCNTCQKQIDKKAHPIETGGYLCDKCFEKHKAALNRERVNRSRNKQKKENNK